MAYNYGRPAPQGYYNPQQPQQQYMSPHPQYMQGAPQSLYTPKTQYAQSPMPGYPSPNVRPPVRQAPPGADPTLWFWFTSVDVDNSGALTTEELQRALVNGDWSNFNIETVRLMMNMFDTDNSGTISFQEFSGLWKYINEWKQLFQQFDVDGSGTIDRKELMIALQSFGYNLSQNFIDLLIKKYDRQGHGNITFDNFVQTCVTVKGLTEAFRRFDTDNDGWIQVSYEQFLELVVMNR